MIMNRAVVVSISLLLGGCFAPGFTDEMPDDLPAGNCPDTDAEDCVTTSTSGAESGGESSSSSSSSTSGTPADDCQGSDGCLGEDACVAAWDGEAEARGAFACQFACVPLLDESLWCSDDVSCCDADAVCTGRGYCVLGGGS